MAASIEGMDRRQLLRFLCATGLGALGTVEGVSLSYAADTRTLRAAITNYTVINALDPAFANSIAESMVLWGIFNGLVKFDVGMKIVPDLAESWTNPDANTWVFNLRRGVKFHDGSELTSDDVKFTFERLRGEGSNSPFKTYFTSVAQIEAVDPYTVKFVTNEPFAPLLTFLTNTRTGAQIVPRKAVESAGKGFGQKPIGTGAFKFVELIPGQKVILEANKQYFVSGQPKLDRVEISLIEQETSVVSAILAGDIDLSNSAPVADVAALQKNPAIHVARDVGLNIRFVELNNTIPPFNDVHFRRAVSMAFDRQALVQVVVFGEGQIANGPVPPPLKWAFDANQHPVYAFNPDAARAELEKSQYKKGTKATVLTFGSSWWKRWAEIMVEQVNDTLSTELAVEVIDANSLTSRIIANNLQASVWGWLGFIDPDEYLYTMCHSKGARNTRGYSNPALDQLLEQGRRELDLTKRGDVYRQAQAIIAEDCPFLSCFYSNQDNLWAPRVQGFQPLPYSAFAGQFANVSLNA